MARYLSDNCYCNGDLYAVRLHSESVDADVINAGDLHYDSMSYDTIAADEGNFNTLTANTLNCDNVSYSSLNVSNFESTNLNVTETATINNLQLSNLNVRYIDNAQRIGSQLIGANSLTAIWTNSSFGICHNSSPSLQKYSMPTKTVLR